MKTLSSFYSNVFDNDLAKEGDKIILAVSGGADSMSMMHLFWMLSKKTKIELLVLNLDHNLRKESLKEAQIVKKMSERLNIKCILDKIEPLKYAKENSVSLETAGRILRYESFERTAGKFKFNKISTAHNANDNAETALMRLLRGGGNFAGIPLRRKLAANIEVIRPMLNIARKDIELYAAEQNLPFCTDQSNFSDIFLRNRIRKNILPALVKINPKIVEHIFNLTSIQAVEEDYLDQICAKIASKIIKKKPNQIIIELKGFLGYNPALRYRLLKNVIPEKQNSFQINFLAKKISLSDKSPHILSKDWVFKISGSKAVFKKVRH